MTRANTIAEASKVWRHLCLVAGIATEAINITLISRKTAADRAHLVLRLDRTDGPPLAFKQDLSQAPVEKFTGIVAGIKSAAERMAANTQNRAPRLFSYDLAARALLMEFVEGDSLAQAIKSAKDPIRDIGRAARWLADFHQSGAEGNRAFWPKYLLDQIERIVLTLRSGDRTIINSSEFIASAAQFGRLLRPLRGVMTPVAIRHGDATANNLILSSQTVWGIDVFSPETMAVALDLGRFLESAAMTTSGAGAISPKAVFETLLAHYDSAMPDPDLIDCLVRYRALTRWARMPTDPRSLTQEEQHRLSYRMRTAAQGMT
jgi:tRNA A-37 threonylcarbamoyl transferase component Bud32